MKRAASLILLLVYFTVTTGFSVNLHYCMDDLQSWELGSGGDEECTVCGMETGDNDGCCRDEVQLVKLQNDDFDTYAVSFKFQLPLSKDQFWSIERLEYHITSTAELLAPHPDTGRGQDTYLRNCVFRI